MDVSIIIPSFNTKELTLNCIRSIEEDTSELKREVILVDNASEDGTVETLKKIAFKNIKLIIIENDKNIGYAKACNRGIRRSSGKYILLLNSDTRVLDRSIDKLMEFADSTFDLGVAGPRLINSDGTIQPSCYRLPTLWRTIRQYVFGEKKLLDKYYPEGNSPVKVEALVGAVFLITPKAIKEIGLLDERYFMYFEDLDYCRRAKKKSLSVYYLPTPKMIHFHGVSGEHLASAENQWKRLIPSSKIYHGLVTYYLIYFVTKIARVCSKILKKS